MALLLWGLCFVYFAFSDVRRKLGKISRRSLVVFAEDPSEDLESALLSFYMWELCFSLVSPLWDLCYSLAPC